MKLIYSYILSTLLSNHNWKFLRFLFLYNDSRKNKELTTYIFFFMCELNWRNKNGFLLEEKVFSGVCCFVKGGQRKTGFPGF